MLLATITLATQSFTPTPVPLPSVPRATLSRTPINLKVTRVPTLPDNVTLLKGRKVAFQPKEPFPQVWISAVGNDGTAVLYRSSYGQFTSFRYSIASAARETPVKMLGHAATIDVYRNAQNFAGSFYEDETQNENDMMVPQDERFAFVCENGVPRIVGRGAVANWQPGGPIAMVPFVDESGKASGLEAFGQTNVWIRDQDRLITLGAVRPVPGNAFAFYRANRLYRWRNHTLQGWAQLPAGWNAQTATGDLAILRNDKGELALLKGQTIRRLRMPALKKSEFPESISDLKPDGTFTFKVGEKTKYAARIPAQ